jgi:hypothetical protein
MAVSGGRRGWALVYMATGSLFTYGVFDELWWC